MTPALIMLVIPGLPSYNGVEVYHLKGVIGLPIVISFRDRRYIHIFFFFFGNGLIDDVIVIGWTDSDFKISRALIWGHSVLQTPALVYVTKCRGCREEYIGVTSCVKGLPYITSNLQPPNRNAKGK